MSDPVTNRDEASTAPAAAAGFETATAESRTAAIRLVNEGIALESQGRRTEALARYDAAAQADPQNARAHMGRGNLLLTGARLDEARAAYQRAIACDPHLAGARFNLGNLNYLAEEFADALSNYEVATRSMPQFAGGFIGMANALAKLGRTAEAMETYRRALSIEPRNADGHFNLGVLALGQDRRDEAMRSLRSAIALRPEHAAAHRMLGNVYASSGDFEAAEICLRRAGSIEPGSDEIMYELAMILQYRGMYPQALPLLVRALERSPSLAVKEAFANCVSQVRFTADDPPARAALATAIAEAWVMPHNLCRPALSLIVLDERIARCVRLANESWPARPMRSELFGASGLEALATDRLLPALLDAVPVNSLEFERFLTCARHALLEVGSGHFAPQPADFSALGFYAALARQCFINEFVFDCRDDERSAAEACRTELLPLLDSNEPIPPLLLLAVAAYFPLHLIRDAHRLLGAVKSEPVIEVLRQQVLEPLEEQALRTSVRRLTAIQGGISEAVRTQYEQNPYPRWVKLPLRGPAQPFNVELPRILPFAPPTTMSDDRAPEVLVAGCGTGSDALFVAQRFRGMRVLAIDLSLNSISYALRKTRELGLANIDYAQADILGLGGIDRSFDIIGAIGVLHHLADPFAGWRILLSRLRPGGFMCVGLYSQIARRQLVAVRQFITARGYSSTADDIRRFRQDALAEGAPVELRALADSQAYYSLSDCRDLAFHIQEQSLTLDQIEAFLAECGLQFLGFELDLRVLDQYRARFAGDVNCTDLGNWASFEADHPDTFTAMYRFWVHQPARR
jgi:tetratricopeptide (TPR) repeat protein/SAM-dependent methyltransferase